MGGGTISKKPQSITPAEPFHSDVGLEVTHPAPIFGSHFRHNLDATHGVSHEEPWRRGRDPNETTPRKKVSCM